MVTPVTGSHRKGGVKKRREQGKGRLWTSPGGSLASGAEYPSQLKEMSQE